MLQRTGAAVGALVLLLFAGAALQPVHLPGARPPALAPSGGLTPVVQHASTILTSPTTAPPVPPPAGATPIVQEVTPATQPGTPYLHMEVWSYQAPITAQALYAHYVPQILELGYSANLHGESCQRDAGCAPFWGFRRGQLATILLTVAIGQGQTTRYSFALQRIEPPPRPKGRFVPTAVRSVRTTEDAASMELRSQQQIASLRRIVNALPVALSTVFSCTMDTGERAEIVFRTPGDAMVFRENPACDIVFGPHGAVLRDPGFKLWDAISQLFGLPPSGAPSSDIGGRG